MTRTISAPAGGALDGTVTFTLYDNATCTGDIVYGPVDVDVAGASPRTVSTSNTEEITASGTFSWGVAYDSKNAAQEDISEKCHETSSLTISNGGTVSSP